ncbi:MAG: hypothetical protein K5842_07245 [Bacteroidales bacterium]|nr:hypothetical protein [Bacteroidales bacterium]
MNTDIQPEKTNKNNVWQAFVMLLSISIGAAALSAVMVCFFEKIRIIIPELVTVVCLMGIVISYLLVRKHPAKQRCRELIIVSANYLIIVLAALFHPAGLVVDVLYLGLFGMMFVISDNQAKDVQSSLLFNASSVFSMTMSVTFGGLLYARNISDDGGTLYITFLAGLIFAALGFVVATIILFSVSCFKGLNNRLFVK